MNRYLALILLLFSAFTYSGEETPELKIVEISKGVYLHQSFHLTDVFGMVSANGLIVIDDNKAFIIDTPWSNQDTQKLVDWIVKNNYELVGSVSTHSHEDRTAGIKWLNSQSIPTYATELTNDLLKSKKRDLAKHTILDSEATLAGGLVEVFYPGGGHTIDNVVVWLPRSKILFGGCLVRSLESNGLGYTGEAYIEQWPSSVSNVLAKYSEAEVVVPGHGGIGGLALLEHTKLLAEQAAKKIIQSKANASTD